MALLPEPQAVWFCGIVPHPFGEQVVRMAIPPPTPTADDFPSDSGWEKNILGIWSCLLRE